jgi:glycosyltransferase involved in cell wall biosynthesis
MRLLETRVPEGVIEAVRPVGASHRPVKAAFLIDDLGLGGTETQLLALLRHLDRARVSPYLCILRGKSAGSRAMEPSDCPVVRLEAGALRNPLIIAKALRFARFLREEKIDVLQTYFPNSTYFGVAVGQLAGVGAIVRSRNDVGHWMTPKHRILGRIISRSRAVTAANSEACRQSLIAEERGDPGRVHVLENGVDLERFEDIPAYDPHRPRQGPRRVGLVGNLRSVKRIDVFVAAAAEVAKTHPDVVFQVAGEGELTSELQEQALSLGLKDQFELLGALRTIPAFLRVLEVAVLCSDAEGMSNSLLEYMAAGRPIVATAVGGTPGMLMHETHGLLVEPGSPPQLAAAIRRLLDDQMLAASLGAAARRRAQSLYSRQAMAERFTRFYESLVHRD